MTQERQLVSINIKEENGKQTVSARELHEKLGLDSCSDVDFLFQGV